MKKTLITMLLAVLCVGCGKNTSTTSTTPGGATTSDSTADSTPVPPTNDELALAAWDAYVLSTETGLSLNDLQTSINSYLFTVLDENGLFVNIIAALDDIYKATPTDNDIYFDIIVSRILDLDSANVTLTDNVMNVSDGFMSVDVTFTGDFGTTWTAFSAFFADEYFSNLSVLTVPQKETLKNLFIDVVVAVLEDGPTVTCSKINDDMNATTIDTLDDVVAGHFQLALQTAFYDPISSEGVFNYFFESYGILAEEVVVAIFSDAFLIPLATAEPNKADEIISWAMNAVSYCDFDVTSTDAVIPFHLYDYTVNVTLNSDFKTRIADLSDDLSDPHITTEELEDLFLDTYKFYLKATANTALLIADIDPAFDSLPSIAVVVTDSSTYLFWKSAVESFQYANDMEDMLFNIIDAAFAFSFKKSIVSLIIASFPTPTDDPDFEDKVAALDSHLGWNAEFIFTFNDDGNLDFEIHGYDEDYNLVPTGVTGTATITGEFQDQFNDYFDFAADFAGVEGTDLDNDDLAAIEPEVKALVKNIILHTTVDHFTGNTVDFITGATLKKDDAAVTFDILFTTLGVVLPDDDNPGGIIPL